MPARQQAPDVINLLTFYSHPPFKWAKRVDVGEAIGPFNVA
jgi:hypothetical protein